MPEHICSKSWCIERIIEGLRITVMYDTLMMFLVLCVKINTTIIQLSVKIIINYEIIRTKSSALEERYQLKL